MPFPFISIAMYGRIVHHRLRSRWKIVSDPWRLSRILVLPQKHQEELPSFSSFDIPYSRDNRVNTGPRSWMRRRNLAETATALGCQSCHKMSTGLLPWCSFPESSVLLWTYQNKQSQDTKMCQLGWVRFAQNHETTKYLFTDRPTANHRQFHICIYIYIYVRTNLCP
jgi:hypothetical protein